MNSEIYNCTYELREGEQTVATGRVTLTEPPQTGSALRLGKRVVVIEDAVALGHEYRLVLRDS